MLKRIIVLALCAFISIAYTPGMAYALGESDTAGGEDPAAASVENGQDNEQDHDGAGIAAESQPDEAAGKKAASAEATEGGNRGVTEGEVTEGDTGDEETVVTNRQPEPQLDPEVLWAGCEYYSPASFDTDMDGAELINVTSSNTNVIKVHMYDDVDHPMIDDYYLEPLTPGTSLITVKYSLNGTTGTASAVFTVKPFPTFASSLTIDGEAVDLSNNKNYYHQYNYTGTEPTIKYAPANGWQIVYGYYFLEDGSGEDDGYTEIDDNDLDNIKNGLEFSFPEECEALRMFFDFENEDGETIMHSVQLCRGEGYEPEETGLYTETVWVDCSYGTYLNLTGDLSGAEITSAVSSDANTISVHEAEWGGFYLLAEKPGTATITVTYELDDGVTGTVDAEFTAKAFPNFLKSLKIDGNDAGESEQKNDYYVYEYTGTNPSVEYTPADGWEIIGVWLNIHEDFIDIDVDDYINDPSFAFPAEYSEAILGVEFENSDGDTIRHTTTLCRDSDWHGDDDEPEYWISTGHADARRMGLPGHEFEMYATPNHGYTDENGEYQEESEGLRLKWSYAIASKLPDWSVDNDGVEPEDDDWEVVPETGLSTPFADFTVTKGDEGDAEETGHLKFKALGTDSSGKDAIENRFFIKVEIVDDEGEVLAEDYFESYNCFKAYEVIYPYELEDSCIEPGEKFEDIKFEVRKYSDENTQTEDNDGYTLVDASDLTFTWGENEAGSGDVIRITDSNGDLVTLDTPTSENTFTLERLSSDYASLYLRAEWTEQGDPFDTKNDYVLDEVEVCEHEWDNGEVTIQPTCETTGVKTYTCSICDKTKTEEIEALGHTPAKVDAVEASCETTGVSEHWECSRCHKVFTDADCESETTLVDLTIPSLGHVINKVDAVEASCETTGVSEHWECSRCHKLFSDANGNNETTLDAVTVDALDHDWGDWTDCEDGSNHQRVCARDNTHKETAAHEWDAGEVITAATYWEDGEKKLTCEKCGATKNEVIPKLVGKGWTKIDGYWYFYESDGTMAKSVWKKDSKGWCYLGADGRMVTNDWAKDSKGWCWIGPNGYMVEKTQWLQDGDDWYHITKGYRTVNKWMKDGKGWMYLGSDGLAVKKVWKKDSKGWCYLGEDGYMVTNDWAPDSKGWCWIGSDGYMVEKNKWIQYEGGWYYIEKGYRAQNKWRKDSKGWCYLGSDGRMVTNDWAKDSKGWCWIGPDGYMIEKDMWIGDEGAAGSSYINKGYRVDNKKITINGVEYTFDADGKLVA